MSDDPLDEVARKALQEGGIGNWASVWIIILFRTAVVLSFAIAILLALVWVLLGEIPGPWPVPAK
jgi:hypothetical protein